ncbi:MAG TPA: DUF2948 family protein [Methylomirabilota bacterium]|jgi:hypothetical protein|nr:DUF2948 family protein [Methylomirabilota bacterium]
MPDLKLIALDADDLAIVSAHLQDAVLKVGDLAFLPRKKKFAAVANRFDWIDAIEKDGARDRRYARRRSALRFERVLGAQVSGLDLKDKNAVAELLAIRFEPADPPQGLVTLDFAGGGAIRLRVECIEAELRDLGPTWEARSRPRHPEEPPKRP